MAEIDFSKLNRQQKLAVFLVVIGAEAAANVLKQFDEPEIELLCREISAFTTCSVSKPGLTESRRAKLRNNSPAATRRTMARATSVTARKLRARSEPLASPAPGPSLRFVCGTERNAYSTGARPNTMLAASDNAKAKPRTAPSTRMA